MATAPALLEYQPGTERGRWRAERFDLLAAECFTSGNIRITASTDPTHDEVWSSAMSLFHDLLRSHPRQWTILRRLYGIMPIVFSPENPRDLHAWDRAELCVEMGIDEEQLRAELGAVRTVWAGSQLQVESCRLQVGGSAQANTNEPAPEPSTFNLQPATNNLPFGDDVLAEFDFSEDIFEAQIYDAATKSYRPREAKFNRLERDWFCKRVSAWRVMLTEHMTSRLANAALINELQLRRLSHEIAKHLPGSPGRTAMLKEQQDIEIIYQAQLKQLDEIFPYISKIGGKFGFRECISEVIDAYHAYYADGSKVLVDKIFTADEIEIQLLMSEQMPVPMYRAGLNVYLVEAQRGIHDPNWESQFKKGTLRKIDHGFQEAIMKLRQEDGEALVDLENKDDEFTEKAEG